LFLTNKFCSVSCNDPIWIQYKEHRRIFDVIEKKMKPFNNYYHHYKEILKKFYITARTPESNSRSKKLKEYYKGLWEMICGFFSSKEYLGSYNPVFLMINEKQKKDEIIGKLFGLNENDIEKDFYEILLHLMRKIILKEKYENLKKLQRVVFLARKWKEFYNHKCSI